MSHKTTHAWYKRPQGSFRAKRQTWWDRQRDEVEQVRSNSKAPPGTFAWACLHGPDLCKRIREARPDLATWTRKDIRENREQR